MFGEYKLIACGIIALFLIGLGTTAVLSYNHYIKETGRLEAAVKTRDEVIAGQHAVVAEQQRQAQVARQYQTDMDKRHLADDARLKKILTMESKRDDKGKIIVTDPILGALNGMYPGSSAVDKGGANNPARASVPKKPEAAGGVAGGKDILPE